MNRLEDFFVRYPYTNKIIIHFQSYSGNLFIIKIDYFLNYNDIFPCLKENNGYTVLFIEVRGFPDNSVGKESACNAGDPDSILGQEDLLEKGQTNHSSG